MGDPDVGAHILHPVVLHGGLGVAHDLDDDEVSRVGHDKRALFAERGVELVIQLHGVLEDELVFDFPFAQIRKPLLGRESIQHVFLHPHEVARHVGRPYLEQRHLAVVVHRGDQTALTRRQSRARRTSSRSAVAPWDPAGPPAGCSSLRAPRAIRPRLRGRGRRRQCRRLCRCRGCASGWTARRYACRAREPCRQTRSRRTRLPPRAISGTTPREAGDRRGRDSWPQPDPGPLMWVLSLSMVILRSRVHSRDGQADRCVPAAPPPNPAPGRKECRRASPARRCTC